jgi:metal-responsive CopG/Arc/MetJ family transcriptional regulator
MIDGYPHRIPRKVYMKAISLKWPDDLLESSGRYAKALRLSRAEYIRNATEKMNRETAARLRAKRLAAVSLRVRKESMRVNAEFAATERDVDD